MSIVPLLQRRGSLLVPIGPGSLDVSFASKRSAPQGSPRRNSYSELYVLSPSVGAVVLKSRLEEALLAWADTEPGVSDVALVNQQVKFLVGRRPKTAVVPLLVTNSDGSHSYWDGSFGNSEGMRHSASVSAKREFAAAAEAGYRLMTWEFFSERRAELKSRLAMQNILYSGIDLVTSNFESEAMLLLARTSYSVAELAALVDADDFAMLVAVSRLWRAGKVSWPTTAALPSSSLVVTRGEAHGR